MNVVDSSGWLEYFAEGPNAGFFTAAIEKPADLVVPTISLYEVFKRVLQQRDHVTPQVRVARNDWRGHGTSRRQRTLKSGHPRADALSRARRCR